MKISIIRKNNHHLKRCFLITILFLIAGLLPLHSQMTRNVKRPKITGVAHAAFFVKNIDHAINRS